MTPILRVLIPLTNDDCLGQNARCDKHERARQTRELRKAAKYAVVDYINAGGPVPLPERGRIGVRWTIYWARDRREHDDDGAGGKLKAARDGIADALGVNDRRFKTLAVEQVRTGERQSDILAELVHIGGEAR